MNITGRSQGLSLPGAKRPCGAFTLIELLAVVTLLGLIGVALGGPTLSHLSSMRTRGSAARIASDMRYAQRWAMATRNRTWMAFSVIGNAYTLYVENPANPGKANRQMLARALDNTTGATDVGESPFSGASLTSASFGATNELSFDSFGRPYDADGTMLAAQGQVQLVGGVNVSVLPVSGLVEVSG